MNCTVRLGGIEIRPVGLVALTLLVVFGLHCGSNGTGGGDDEGSDTRNAARKQKRAGNICNVRRVIGACRADKESKAFDTLLVGSEEDIEPVRQLLRDGSFELMLNPKAVREILVVGDFIAVLDPSKTQADTTREEPEAVHEGSGRRPAPIGVSIGHETGSESGTIGCRVKDATDATKVYALSAAHVLRPSTRTAVGSWVLQPGWSDGGTVERDKLGKLGKTSALVFDLEVANLFDAGLAVTTPRCLKTESDHPTYGRPGTKPYWPKVKDRVMHYGKRSKFQKGEVRCVGAEVCVRYGGKKARFVNQIVVNKPGGGKYCRPGDSGALSLVAADHEAARRPVGLFFAYGTLKHKDDDKKKLRISNACILSPIETVLGELRVEIDDTEVDPPGDCVPAAIDE